MTPCDVRSLFPNLRRSIVILLIGTALFLLVGEKDSVWTFSFWQHPWPVYTDVMARSLYEGDLPGVSDIGVTIPILAFLFWLKIRHEPDKIQFATKLKYLFACGFIASLLTVQFFKLVVSRARPKVYATEVLPNLHIDPATVWLPGYMGWAGPRGYSWNSFPSGHTGTCAILLALVYVIPRENRMTRSLTAVAVVSLTFAMMIARSMAGMHWISDSVASFFIVWSIVDFLAGKML